MSTSDSKIIQVFSDESGYDGSSQFGSIAKIAGIREHQALLNKELSCILIEFNVHEFKFTKLKSYDMVNLANRFLDVSIDYMNRGLITIHVIVWDKKDSRHSVAGRCDIANLCRMYYHNFCSIKKAWKIDADWQFFPDQFSQIDWHSDIIKYINNRPLRRIASLEPDLFDFYRTIKVVYSVVKELDSKSFPIIQLADLYAGLCRFSRQEHVKFKSWELYNQNQICLFNEPITGFSNSEKYRFHVKSHLKMQSDKYKLGVNISKNGYLQTFIPGQKLNIWNYKPQGEYDKAPTLKTPKSATS